jgi:hypothetical protein
LGFFKTRRERDFRRVSSSSGGPRDQLREVFLSGDFRAPRTHAGIDLLAHGAQKLVRFVGFREEGDAFAEPRDARE